MSIDSKILDRFTEVSKRVILVKRKVASSFNVSVNYYKTFAVLLTKENINQTTLSDIYCIDKPATSRIVSSMEKDGYIRKEFKDGNKKTTYISLTKEGKELACKMAKMVEEECSNYFNELKEKDKKRLLKLLDHSIKEGDDA